MLLLLSFFTSKRASICCRSFCSILRSSSSVSVVRSDGIGGGGIAYGIINGYGGIINGAAAVREGGGGNGTDELLSPSTLFAKFKVEAPENFYNLITLLIIYSSFQQKT